MDWKNPQSRPRLKQIFFLVSDFFRLPFKLPGTELADLTSHFGILFQRFRRFLIAFDFADLGCLPLS